MTVEIETFEPTARDTVRVRSIAKGGDDGGNLPGTLRPAYTEAFHREFYRYWAGAMA